MRLCLLSLAYIGKHVLCLLHANFWEHEFCNTRWDPESQAFILQLNIWMGEKHSTWMSADFCFLLNCF